MRSTHKITSAMMMISSSKLRKMQRLIQNLSPYEERMAHLMKTLMQADHDFVSPFTRRREVKRVAIVAFSSNTGLVGRFNDNIIETLKTTVDSYAHLGKENILLYPIGNKIQNAVKKLQLTGQAEAQRVVADHPSYDSARQVAEKLLSLFLAEEIDKVELIYHHYQSKSRQILTRETFLPIEPDTQTEETSTDYIFEPDKQTLLDEIIPKVLKLRLYFVHANSAISEQAARTVAMQIATDNANELLDELTLQYNKLRQQTITNELLDIVGGSFGKEG